MRFGKADVHTRWVLNKMGVAEARECRNEYKNLRNCMVNEFGESSRCLGALLRVQLCMQQNKRDYNKARNMMKNTGYQLSQFARKLK